MDHFGRRALGFGGGSGCGAVRCRHCSASLPAMPGARVIQCAQCYGVTRVGGRGRRRHPTRSSRGARPCRCAWPAAASSRAPAARSAPS
ncbi:hypothetical protein EE612_017799 [Oryza sativa]|nr:hypothetical protein EE612_017799 [Oryza sativa]